MLASATSGRVMGHSQFGLLKQRRFAPYFFTQILGAFNDNVFKNSLVAVSYTHLTLPTIYSV